MPFGNGMGPAGMGPLSGRGAGFCAGYGIPGSLNPAIGRGPWGAGAGFGLGRGRGHRNRYWATGLFGWQRAPRGQPGAYPYAAPAPFVQPSAGQELSALRGQLKAMQQGIEEVQERIEELERDEDGEKK